MLKDFSLKSTKELLTPHAGAIGLGRYLDTIGFQERIDTLLPAPRSNRGLPASSFVQSLVYVFHLGGKHLEDVRLLHRDQALQALLTRRVPSACALGAWLKRTGSNAVAMRGLNQLQREVIANYLAHFPVRHDVPRVLDIDATVIASNKYDARWTYKDCKGYTPMIAHLHGCVVYDEFREGHVAPAERNLETIHNAIANLPSHYPITHVRADSAAYQADIVNYCNESGYRFAIGARKSEAMREAIRALPETAWRPFVDRYGVRRSREVASLAWSMEHTHQAFTLVVTRKPKKVSDLFEGFYDYHAIATNDYDTPPDAIVRFYTERADASENSIKALKSGFHLDTLPCGSFAANAAFFRIGVMAYNLFLLAKWDIGGKTVQKLQINTIRLHIYQLAAKLVRTGRKTFLTVEAKAYRLFCLFQQKIKRLPKLAEP